MINFLNISKGFVAHGAMGSHTLKKSEKELEIVLFGGCAHEGGTEVSHWTLNISREVGPFLKECQRVSIFWLVKREFFAR